jgi:hypothetical protein
MIDRQGNNPLADVRGYAYEHRLKAEKQLRRPLREGEEVHHDDENKSNNDPQNLIVAASHAEHALFHRKRADLRFPGEGNPTIECACGCGEIFLRFDDDGRPRSYLSGHNDHPSPTMHRILKSLSEGPKSLREIAPELSLTAVKVALTKLKTYGRVASVRHGVWRIANG